LIIIETLAIVRHQVVPAVVDHFLIDSVRKFHYLVLPVYWAPVFALLESDLLVAAPEIDDILVVKLRSLYYRVAVRVAQ
jgi:hypothetical protein